MIVNRSEHLFKSLFEIRLPFWSEALPNLNIKRRSIKSVMTFSRLQSSSSLFSLSRFCNRSSLPWFQCFSEIQISIIDMGTSWKTLFLIGTYEKNEKKTEKVRVERAGANLHSAAATRRHAPPVLFWGCSTRFFLFFKVPLGSLFHYPSLDVKIYKHIWNW